MVGRGTLLVVVVRYASAAIDVGSRVSLATVLSECELGCVCGWVGVCVCGCGGRIQMLVRFDRCVHCACVLSGEKIYEYIYIYI